MSDDLQRLIPRVDQVQLASIKSEIYTAWDDVGRGEKYHSRVELLGQHYKKNRQSGWSWIEGKSRSRRSEWRRSCLWILYLFYKLIKAAHYTLRKVYNSQVVIDYTILLYWLACTATAPSPPKPAWPKGVYYSLSSLLSPFFNFDFKLPFPLKLAFSSTSTIL